LQRVFPYVFRLARVLGGIAILTGLGLAWSTQLDFTRLLTTAWDLRILAGGSLGGACTRSTLLRNQSWNARSQFVCFLHR
jgi:hypothetical protein